MEISSLSLDDRVFKIDNECYIVYLGTDREDEKPFLRIGNSKKLTQDIISNISNIVITDSITGDPTLEAQNINTEDLSSNRYIGDDRTVSNFIEFVRQFNVKNGNVGSLEDVKTEHDRAEVLFYNDGNIHLLYNQKLLFDLRKREKEDLHFIEKSIMLKGIFSKNPLRYASRDYQNPGFFLIRNSFILFDRGKCLAQGLPEDYFQSLLVSGVDPDLIETVITDDISRSLINLLKRKRFKNEALKIYTGRKSLLRSAAGLFKGVPGNPLKADIVSFKQGEGKTFYNCRIGKSENGYTVRHSLLPRPLFISENIAHSDRERFTVNTGRGILIPPEKTGKPLILPEGIIHIFCREYPGNDEMLTTYVKDLISFTENQRGSEESVLVKMIEQFFDGVIHGTGVKNIFAKIKKQVKKTKLNPKSGTIYILINTGAICSYYVKRETGRSTGRSVLSDLNDLMYKVCSSTGRMDIRLPLIGDTFLSDDHCSVLYRPVKGFTTKEEFLSSLEVAQIVEENVLKSKLIHDREKERLVQLINDLSAVPRKVKRVKPAIVTAGTVTAGRAEIKERVKSTVIQEKKVEYVETSEGMAAEEKVKRRLIRILIPSVTAIVAAVIAVWVLLVPGPRSERETMRTEEREEGLRSTEPAIEGPVEEPVEESIRAAQETIPADKFLEEKGIPRSTLTEQRTVLYRGIIEITLRDIFLLTNIIAVRNGYRELGSISSMGKDPDWIFPGNLFILPDGSEYTVIGGDTQWFIAHRFIIQSLENDWDRYIRITKEIDRKGITTDNKTTWLAQLEAMKARSYSENFTREIERNIAKLKNRG